VKHARDRNSESMGKAPEEATIHIAELEARVAGLEEALKQRSLELRDLQRQLGLHDLLWLSRRRAGLPVSSRGAYTPDLWSESTELLPAEVEETLKDLWLAVGPERDEEDP